MLPTKIMPPWHWLLPPHCIIAEEIKAQRGRVIGSGHMASPQGDKQSWNPDQSVRRAWILLSICWLLSGGLPLPTPGQWRILPHSRLWCRRRLISWVAVSLGVRWLGRMLGNFPSLPSKIDSAIYNEDCHFLCMFRVLDVDLHLCESVYLCVCRARALGNWDYRSLLSQHVRAPGLIPSTT